MGVHAIASIMNCPDPLRVDFLERTRLSESIHNRSVLRDIMTVTA